jgi:hypothetical protein
MIRIRMTALLSAAFVGGATAVESCPLGSYMTTYVQET